VRENKFSDQFKRFAAECFAYAGEALLLGSGKENLGKLPAEMAGYFEKKNILL
jgi:hypothetical protein